MLPSALFSFGARLWILSVFLVVACAPAVAPTPAPPTKGEEPQAAPKPQAEAPKPTQPIQLKLASPVPEGDISSQAIKFWGDLVTQRSEGRITFQYFWAGSLLDATQVFDGVADGRADLGFPATSYISGKMPDLAILEVPFAYPLGEAEVLRFHDEVNPIIDELYQRFNQKLLWSNPAITGAPVVCRDRFLPSAQDWKGALVRTAGRWQAETVKAWGAQPVSLALGDVYVGLQRRTVDCALLVYSLMDSFKVYEVAKSITRIDHSNNYGGPTINVQVWAKLAPQDQKIMIEAGREAQKKGLELRRDLVERAIAKFRAQGVQFCTPASSELQRLRDATDAIWEMIRREPNFTAAGERLMQVARKYRGTVASAPTEGEITPCPR